MSGYFAAQNTNNDELGGFLVFEAKQSCKQTLASEVRAADTHDKSP